MRKPTRYRVLLYHGVHADEVETKGRNSSGKHVSRTDFAAQMADLAARFDVVAMADIAAAHRGECALPSDAVAVTFDDGFLNNYTVAWPVLEKNRIPATVYLATGFIGTGRMMWSDLLEHAFLTAEPREITVATCSWQRSFQIDDAQGRITAFTIVKQLCKSLSNTEKDSLVDAVCRELNVQPDPDNPLYAFMTWDHVREMAASPLISFGAHTIDHVSLTKVNEDEMRRQIDESVATLVRELGHPCRLFSYPEGQERDFDKRVIDWLKWRGFDHAPTAIDGTNTLARTDPFRIRRTMVGFEGRPYPFGPIQ